MTTWKTEEDFAQDRCLLSEFYYINEPKNQFVFKSSKPEAKKSQSFYFDSGSESEDNLDLDTEPTSNEELFGSIRQQVRNAIGNRYSNDAIETYYNVERHIRKLENGTVKENLDTVASPSKDVSTEHQYLNNNVPTKAANSMRCSVAANIENSIKTVGSSKLQEPAEPNLPKSGSSSRTSSRSSRSRRQYRNGGSGDAQLNESPNKYEFKNGFNYKRGNKDYVAPRIRRLIPNVELYFWN